MFIVVFDDYKLQLLLQYSIFYVDSIILQAMKLDTGKSNMQQYIIILEKSNCEKNSHLNVTRQFKKEAQVEVNMVSKSNQHNMLNISVTVKKKCQDFSDGSQA